MTQKDIRILPQRTSYKPTFLKINNGDKYNGIYVNIGHNGPTIWYKSQENSIKMQ